MIKVEKTLVITIPEEDRKMLIGILDKAMEATHLSRRAVNDINGEAIHNLAFKLFCMCQDVHCSDIKE